MKSFFYLFRDLALAAGLMTAAFNWIPLIQSPLLRYSVWALYGWVQGLIMTGIWVSPVTTIVHVSSTHESDRSLGMNAAIRISRPPISSMMLWDGRCTPLY